MTINKIFIIFNNFIFECDKGDYFYFMTSNFKLNKGFMNDILNNSKKKIINTINKLYNLPCNCFNIFISYFQNNNYYEKYVIFHNSDILLLNNLFNENDKLIQINVINLPKAKERLINIEKQLEFYNLYYNIFVAIDPSESRFTHLLKYNNIILNNSKKRYGEASCALSHITIIKKFLSSNDEYCIILEDDCNIVKRIPQKVTEYHKIFNDNLDILYISDRIKCNKKGEIISGVGTEGYIINRRGGRKILKICDGIDCGIDLRYQSHYPFFHRKNHKNKKCSNIILNGFRSREVYVLHEDKGKSFIQNTYYI